MAHKSTTGTHLGEVVRVEPERVVVCPIEPGDPIGIHDVVIRKGAFRIAPTDNWCGRTINALAEPIDGLGALLQGDIRRSIANTAPPSMTRKRVEQGFRTGVRAIDIFSPLCLGQRLGIFAGSGVGKSTLLSMLARADAFDKVVIALVGERGREVREFIEDTLGDNLSKSVAVVATSDESPMLRKMAPLTAVTIAEHYRDKGDNVLLIVDSVTVSPMRSVRWRRQRGSRRSPAAIRPRFHRIAAAARAGRARRRGNGHDHGDHFDPGRWRQSQRPGRRLGARHSRRAHRPRPKPCRRGALPPVNPLASISRLARKAWTPDQEKLVARLKSLIHRFEETRDLRLIGGYRPGGDADLDMAIKQVPVIYDVLKQMPGERPAFDAFTDLANALKAAAMGNQPGAAGLRGRG